MTRSRPDAFVAPPDRIRGALSNLGPDDVVFLARQCLEVGAPDHAEAICEAIGDAGAPAVTLCRAVARFVGGDRDGALGLLARVLSEHPEHLSALAVEAEMRLRSGDRAGARQCLSRVVERYPDYPGAHGRLASLLMPGPHYREVLAQIQDRLRPRVYLEIGVDTGATLALARHSEIALGVDPEPCPARDSLPPSTRLFELTSDAFFTGHRPEDLLGDRRVDLGFIDGLHHFEQALRDFSNLERWAHPGATVILHDCVPVLKEAASRNRSTKFWVGDTWKAALALSRHRPDLRIHTLLAPPSGLVVVRGLDPSSQVLTHKMAEIVEELGPLEDAWDPETVPPALHPEPNDSSGLARALC